MADAPYQAGTAGFIVRVRPRYLAAHSEPEAGRWQWAYDIEIVNASDQTAQLLARRWEITDARGRVEVVEGPGVVGETPLLQPGEAFSYTSGCPLGTSSGTMVGCYHMVSAAGAPFTIAIPLFSLDSPDARRTLN